MDLEESTFLTSDTKAVCYSHKERNIDQWHKIEGPETNPRNYGLLIFDKGGKNIQWRKDSLFSKWRWGKLGSCMLINEARAHTFAHTHKKNVKWLKGLNAR